MRDLGGKPSTMWVAAFIRLVIYTEPRSILNVTPGAAERRPGAHSFAEPLSESLQTCGEWKDE